MLISDEFRFLFIHIPKTGGSTLTWRLRDVVNNPRRIDIESRIHEKGWQGELHYNGQHSSLAKNFWQILPRRGFESFAFVRNPWELHFSWYTAISRNMGEAPRKEGFQAFLQSPPEKYRRRVRNTQSSYLCNRFGVTRVKHILRYEKFESEFDRLVSMCGIPETRISRESMNISNPGGQLDYREFYDERSRDFVADIYKEDIVNFGFEF